MTPTAVKPETNGEGLDRQRLDDLLANPVPATQGYRPTLPSWALLNWPDGTPQVYLHRDIELMMIHPMVRNALNYYKAGIYGAEFELDPTAQTPPEVANFVVEQCKRFWDRGVPVLQGAYEYGWIGCECMYDREDDNSPLCWDSLIQFSPRDTFLLTKAKIPVGIRVKNVQGVEHGQVDLFLGTNDVPTKGLWYAHEPRYHAFYGQSQLLGAWRPWRRLAYKDGAETVIDMGIYRFAFCGPVVRYPEEDLQVSTQAGAPGTTFDSQGRPRKYARDYARQQAEMVKAGAGIGLPSTKYHPDQGGDYKWSVEWPEHVLNVDPILNYIKDLRDQISVGVGVPPELIAASETGTGYSGRAIPLETFIVGQQRVADALLWLFTDQVLRPLVKWNWGPGVKFDVKVKSLMESRRAAQAMPSKDAPPDELRQPGGEKSNLPGQRHQGIAPQMPNIPPAPLSITATDRVKEIAARILGRAA